MWCWDQTQDLAWLEKQSQSYGQAFAFMLASFCSSLLTLQPRLALLLYPTSCNVCHSAWNHHAWITKPGITMPGITKPGITMPRVTMPGISLLVFILFEFLLKTVLFLNNKQKPRLSYKTALQRRHVKYESGPKCDRPTTHFSQTTGLPALQSCGAFNSSAKGNWLSPNQASSLKYDCLVEFVCYRDKTLSRFSPV